MKLERFKKRNNKVIGVVLFTIICILLIGSVILYKTFASFEVNHHFNIINGTIEDTGDIYFAFYYDGNIHKDMPSKDSGYILDESKSYCGILGEKEESIKPSLDRETWTIAVTGVTTSRTKCNLYFKNYYTVKINEKEYRVSTNTNELQIENEFTGNVILCNNGITIKEENGINLSNITKDSICNIYETSNLALEHIDNNENYIFFLKDEPTSSELTISETQKVTIDLNGHTKNGTVKNYGTLFLKSSKENQGIMQMGDKTLLYAYGNSHTEIENIKLINNNGHTIYALEQSYIKIINTELDNTTSNNVCGIFTSETGKLEIVNSNISAPYGIGGHGGYINIQDSNITATLLVGIQTNVDKEGNVVLIGNTTITGNTYGILIFQGSLELNGSKEAFPIVKSITQNGIRLDYGIFNYQYGEIYGKLANNIQGATLTRKGTMLTTEEKDGMYHTYLQ